MAAHVLVVDDEAAERRHITEILESQGHSVEGVAGGEAALDRLASADAAPTSAVILDLVMPELDGMTVLHRLVREAPQIPVIVQTMSGGSDSGAAAIRAGAVDFLVRPAEPERVIATLQNALKIGALEGEIVRMRLSRAGALALGDIVTRSPAMERVSQLAIRAARSPVPVLIEGERGVGKELLARAIHGSSARKSRPFIVVRCDAVRAANAGVLLFGDEGNAAEPGGKIREAGGGTLFLDEIGALPREVQAGLARWLAAGEPARPPRASPRLIAATGRRAVDLVAADGFDADLFHRLNAFPIWLPPLRDRRADIPDLARGLLARLAAEAGRPGISGLSTAAMELLMAHYWPGNVRELEHAVLRAVMASDGGELTPREFPSLSRGGPGGSDNWAAARSAAHKSSVADQEQLRGEPGLSPPTRTDRARLARYGVARLLDERGEIRSFGMLEEEVIRFAIGHCGGCLSETARQLGIGRSTLYRKLKDYGIAAGPVAAP